MTRHALICFLALFLVQAAHAQSLNDALQQKYKDHLLALRTPFSSGDQKFDSDGHLLSDPAHGAWLVYGGIYVEKLDLSDDTLQLEGPRGALSNSQKDGKPILIAFSKPVRIEIHLLQPINSLDDAEAVLGRLFYLGNDWAEHAKPEFRRAKTALQRRPSIRSARTTPNSLGLCRHRLLIPAKKPEKPNTRRLSS